MIERTALASALSQKNPSGFPSFTKSQVADIAIKEDSELGKKIRRAMDLGVTKEQAIKYYAFGSANGPQEVKQPKQSFFDRFIQPAAQAIVDYGSAPAAAVSGMVQKGLEKIPGAPDWVSGADAQNLPENLQKSADLARVAGPVVAGVATGGASIPVSAAVAGGAGAGSSLLASGLEAAAGEDQTLGGAATEAVTLGATNAILDAATMGLFRLAKPLIKGNVFDDAAKLAGQEDEALKTTGKIVQGTPEEIEKGRKALQAIDTTGVKTYDDLHKTIGNKISSLIEQQDQLLSEIPGTKRLDELATTVKVGEKTAKDNFVKSAMDGLEELYTKTGNTEGVLKIQTLREAAESAGLTVKQINDLAREYGGGFKAFSDATGQPLTSVNAKMYETVRKGLKNVSRDLMPNNASKVIDEEMSNLIATKGLVKDMVDKVQLLANKVSMRSTGDKLGSFIGKIANALSFGTLGGFVKGSMPSDVGLKTLNSLRIQQNLPKNLAKLTELLKQIDTLPDDQIFQRLREIFGALEEVTKGATKAGAGMMTNDDDE